MLKLKVDGMTCDHCVRAVTKAARASPGVARVVGVDLARGELVVEGSPDTAALIRAITAEGYTARPID